MVLQASKTPTRAADLASPKKCAECGGAIERHGQSIAKAHKQRFCSRTCAGFARYKHRGLGTCQRCGTAIHYKRMVWGGYNRKRFCSPCLRAARAAEKGVAPIEQRTKGELFKNRRGWQSARSAIQKHAREVFMGSTCLKECCVCGYSRHVDVAHLQDVSGFSATALVGEINALTNLVALCPTHHWEYDHGLLERLRDSSEVEHEAHNLAVAGSIPAPASVVVSQG